MKLIEVNNNGTSTFLLNDGRKIKSYQSGYVRIDNSYLDRLYQINKRIEVKNEQGEIVDTRKLTDDEIFKNI